MLYPAPFLRLMEELTKLPGVGPKTAQRLAFYLLKQEPESIAQFAQALVAAKERIRHCSVCQNLTEADPCRLCTNSDRDPSIICVVEEPKDLVALERTSEYRGRYHVLHGAWSPMDGVGLEVLRVQELMERIRAGGVREVILATNPDVEGEATAMYLARLLKPLGVSVTRLAHGLPVGSELDYAADDTIARALQGRREI